MDLHVDTVPPTILPPEPVANDAQVDSESSPRKRRRRVVTLELSHEAEILASLSGQAPADFARDTLDAAVQSILFQVKNALAAVPHKRPSPSTL